MPLIARTQSAPRFGSASFSTLVMVGIALAVLVLGSATWTVRRGDDSARLQGALSGLAPYPGSVLVYITSDDLHVVRNYAVQAPDDQITRYYEQVLEANGWILRQVPQTFPNVGVCAEKDGGARYGYLLGLASWLLRVQSRRRTQPPVRNLRVGSDDREGTRLSGG